MSPTGNGTVTSHLLVESQSGPMSDRFLADALALARSGQRVCVFLVSDGVDAAVRGASPVLAEAIVSGARVWVDEFTLAQRALLVAPLATGAVVVDMARVAELVTAAGTSVVWH